tara:strand:- start:1031 stop:1243 length:213 start_codon:yes stop_codon:yes gene_type:complete
MSEESKETLNQVEQEEETKNATTKTEIKYKLVHDADQYYLKVCKYYRQFPKGEIFTKDQILTTLQELLDE